MQFPNFFVFVNFSYFDLKKSKFSKNYKKFQIFLLLEFWS